MSIYFFLSVRSVVRWLQDAPDGIFPGQYIFFWDDSNSLEEHQAKRENGEENNYEWKRQEKQREGREEKKL